MGIELGARPASTRSSQRLRPGTVYGTRVSVERARVSTYLEEMPDQGRVDRLKWATIVREIINRDFEGNQSRFARAVDVSPKTVGRWLSLENDVSESNVRDIARALHRDPMQLLILVGYLTDAEARRYRTPTRVGYTLLQRIAAAGMQGHDDLARAAGASVDDVAEMIYSDSPAVSSEAKSRIAMALGMSPAELEPSTAPTMLPEFQSLIAEMTAMLSEDSPLNVDDRHALAAVIDLLLRPYRQTVERTRIRIA